MKRIAVLIGGGSRLPALYNDAQQSGAYEIALVVSFKPASAAAGIAFAQERGIPTHSLLLKDFNASGRSRTDYDAHLADVVEAAAPDLVVLAGWGLMLSSAFLGRFPQRIINVHPALLTDDNAPTIETTRGTIPVIRGNHAIADALRLGVRVSGATVHHITADMDAGPVILRREVPVLTDDTPDTLGARIHALEDEILPRAVRSVLAADTKENGMVEQSVLIVGGGGREHALAAAILRSSSAVGVLVYVAPGNPGMAAFTPGLTTLPDIDALDTAAIVGWATQHRPRLVIIGPEAPLAAGLADDLRAAGFAVFGPGADGAQTEASKAWSKAFMQRHNIATAAYATFDSADAAGDYIRTLPDNTQIVVKADGLAAGKGVLVTADKAEAVAFARGALDGALFGAAGARVIIEEFLEGREASVFALINTARTEIIEAYPPLPEAPTIEVIEPVVKLFAPARDYKRVGDGDSGGNTGGMGAFAPIGEWSVGLRSQVLTGIAWRVAEALGKEGIDYRGLLYIGLMLTPGEPKVLEFNCRFGDPETQILLSSLSPRTDLLALLEATAHNRLDPDARAPEEGATEGVGVILAAEGYPGAYAKSQLLPEAALDLWARDPDVHLYCAGVATDAEGRLVANGGRVLTLVATAPTVADARARVYKALAAGERAEGGSFDRLFYRRDIAQGE